jgi:hypothetical protein
MLIARPARAARVHALADAEQGRALAREGRRRPPMERGGNLAGRRLLLSAWPTYLARRRLRPLQHGNVKRTWCGAERIRAGHVAQLCVRIPESLEVSHKPRANHGTDRLRGDGAPLPNVQDCHECAHACLDMWNRSNDHATGSWLLRMADAWLQLGYELESQHRRQESPAV